MSDRTVSERIAQDVIIEREALRAEVTRLRSVIAHAPHARHCEAAAALFPGPCNCWKREV